MANIVSFDLQQAIELSRNGDHKWLLELLPQHVPDPGLCQFVTELVKGSLTLKRYKVTDYRTRQEREGPYRDVVHYVHSKMRVERYNQKLKEFCHYYKTTPEAVEHWLRKGHPPDESREHKAWRKTDRYMNSKSYTKHKGWHPDFEKEALEKLGVDKKGFEEFKKRNRYAEQWEYDTRNP